MGQKQCLLTALRVRLVLCFCAVAVLSGCFRENRATHHRLVTDAFVLTVDGMRLSSQAEADRFPKDSVPTVFGDTALLHDDVTSVAYALQLMSEGVYGGPEACHYKGNYVLTLELVHCPGSQHTANYATALRQLKNWGYIDIDTIQRRHIALFRQGANPQHNAQGGERMMGYSTSSLDLNVPQVLLADTVDGGATLGQWIDGWMESILGTDDELFSFLTGHGYDTVCTDTSTQIYPHARPAYNARFLGLF